MRNIIHTLSEKLVQRKSIFSEESVQKGLQRIMPSHKDWMSLNNSRRVDSHEVFPKSDERKSMKIKAATQ